MPTVLAVVLPDVQHGGGGAMVGWWWWCGCGCRRWRGPAVGGCWWWCWLLVPAVLAAEAVQRSREKTDVAAG